MQHRHEESDEKGVRRGSYGYLDANGVYRKVHYIADKNGFRVMEMKSNEPGLDPAAKSADVKSREPDTSHTSPAAVLQTHKHPIKVMIYDRDLNNRLVKQSFTTSVQGTRVKEKPALSGHFIDNPSYTKQSSFDKASSSPADSVAHVTDHPSAIPHFPDLNPVPSSFPYRFERFPPPPSNSQEHNHNLVQSSHSVPIYQAVKGRLQPDPYQKPLPVHAYRPPESNKTMYDGNVAKGNYYFPLYEPPPITRYAEPSSTYAPYFESSRLNRQHDSNPYEIATQRPATTTPGYLHPLQPVRPFPPIRPDYEQTTQSPYHYFGPKSPNSIHHSPPYEKSPYEPQSPGSQLPFPPYISSYVPPRTTTRPYVSYSSPAMHSDSPHSSSSRERPLQYLDGPGPGAIVGSNRMEPSVFYSDDAYDSEKLANEVFSYAPHRTGPESPPPDSAEPPAGPPSYSPYGPGPGYGSDPLPLIPSEMRGAPPEESTRQRLASYYNSVRNTAAAKEKGEEVPSVLLGIQSALGLEAGVSRLQASGSSDSSEPDNSYTPSHYPSQQQILLLRKGLKNLIPLLSRAKSTNAITAAGSSRREVRTGQRPGGGDGDGYQR